MRFGGRDGWGTRVRRLETGLNFNEFLRRFVLKCRSRGLVRGTPIAAAKPRAKSSRSKEEKRKKREVVSRVLYPN